MSYGSKHDQPVLIHLPSVCIRRDMTGLSGNTRCVGVSRVGADSQTIATDTLAGIGRWGLGEPLHSLVITGPLHPLEEKFLSLVANASLSSSSQS